MNDSTNMIPPGQRREWARHQSKALGHSQAQRRILERLAFWAGRGFVSGRTRQDIAVDLNINERTVNRAIIRFSGEKLITVRRAFKGAGADVFSVNFDAANSDISGAANSDNLSYPIRTICPINSDILATDFEAKEKEKNTPRASTDSDNPRTREEAEKSDVFSKPPGGLKPTVSDIPLSGTPNDSEAHGFDLDGYSNGLRSVASYRPSGGGSKFCENDHEIPASMNPAHCRECREAGQIVRDPASGQLVSPEEMSRRQRRIDALALAWEDAEGDDVERIAEQLHNLGYFDDEVEANEN